MPHSFVDIGERNSTGSIYYQCTYCGVYDMLAPDAPVKSPDFKFQYWIGQGRRGSWVELNCEEALALWISDT